MSEEIEKLRADLKMLQECQEIHVRRTMNYSPYTAHAIQAIEDEIAKLEAEAADPWREAKTFLASMESKTATCWQRDLAHYVRHLEAENARLTSRVAELELEFTPAVLKRADEIRPGDMIVANGKIRLVTETARHAVQYRMQITCDDWGSWFDPSDLFAVLRKPLVEPCPLVENPKLPEPPQPRFGARS